MTLLAIPEQGFVYYPESTPAEGATPAELLAYARGQFDVAAAVVETYLLDAGFPPFDLAVIDVSTRCGIGYWVDGVGGTGPDYPDTQMVVYVNVPPPSNVPVVPDNPPPPPPPVPVDPGLAAQTDG